MSDLEGAIRALRDYQRQADEDGVEVTVSRQALDEVLAALAAAEARAAELAMENKTLLHEFRECVNCDLDNNDCSRSGRLEKERDELRRELADAREQTRAAERGADYWRERRKA